MCASYTCTSFCSHLILQGSAVKTYIILSLEVMCVCAYKYLHACVCVCVNVYACMPTVQSLAAVGFACISTLREWGGGFKDEREVEEWKRGRGGEVSDEGEG